MKQDGEIKAKMKKETDMAIHQAELVFYIEETADPATVQALEEQFQGSSVCSHMVHENMDPGRTELALKLDAEGLALTENGQMLRGDFSRMRLRILPNNLNREMLVKVSRIRDIAGMPTAIDATAGLGEDSFLLAAAGFSVQLYERNPVIAALLWDALRKAAGIPELAEIAGRMQLCAEDSTAAMTQITAAPDLILLDPMFPGRQKSALIKKKFQLLQQLESPCTDEEELFHAALQAHPHKLVVKRPLKGPYLAGHKPDYSIKGKAIRYDCIVTAR